MCVIGTYSRSGVYTWRSGEGYPDTCKHFCTAGVSSGASPSGRSSSGGFYVFKDAMVELLRSATNASFSADRTIYGDDE